MSFSLEKLLDRLHRSYRQMGKADVEKVNTGIQVSGVTKGVAHGRLRKHRFVDFHGVMPGGRAVAIEAKQTGQLNWSWSAVKPHQREILASYGGYGGVAFVYLWYRSAHYVVPWDRIGTGKFRPEEYADCLLGPGESWLDRVS